MAVPRIQMDQEPRTGILDFPLELLSLTFEHFRIDDDDCTQDRTELRDATRALRLTCRRLSDAATLILFSDLIIDLNKESVRRVEELVSRNPLIAASVRKVVISLACYKPGMADDMALFVRARLEDIDQACWRCVPDWHMIRSHLYESELELVDEWYSDSKGPPEQIECLRNGCRIFEAWNMDRYLDHDEDSDVYEFEEVTERGAAVRNYHELVWKAHEAYYEKHQEQLELVESGSFVQSIVRCLGYLRQKGLQFIITDDIKSPYPESVYIINDNDRLLTAMSAPHGWLDNFG
ncbi:hypothetical protein PG988_014558 [Apiospora saccharicola]